MRETVLLCFILILLSSATHVSQGTLDKKYTLPFKSLDELKHMRLVNSVEYEGRDTTIVLFSFDGYNPMQAYEKRLNRICSKEKVDAQQVVIVNMMATDTLALKNRVTDFKIPYYKTPWPDTDTNGDIPITCCYVKGELVWEKRGYDRKLLKKIKKVLLPNN